MPINQNIPYSPDLATRAIGHWVVQLFILVSLWTTGCDNPNAAAPGHPNDTDVALSAAKTESAIDSVDLLEIDESEDFAAEFEEAVLRGDHNGMTNRIDWLALLATATAGIDAPADFRQQFIDDALHAKGDLARQLSAASRPGGFRLLRVYTRDDETRALFRSIFRSGVRYQELILGRNADGEVCATDVYFYKSAERLSRTMRRMYLVAAAEQPSNPLAGLLGRDNDFVKHAEEFRQMPILLNAGKPKEVAEIYDSLPTQMKSEKTVMLLYVLAAQRIDDATYTEAIDRFRQQHPDDPCLDMVSIDGYVLRAQYDEALLAVDRVDEAVGGDPYMNVVRANIHRMQGDLTKSAALAQKAMDQDPKLLDAYWALLTVSLEEKEFRETANWLTTIRDKFDIEFDDIENIPDYAEFLESPEYAEWSKEE